MARRNAARQPRQSEGAISEPEETAPQTRARRSHRLSATPSSIPLPPVTSTRKIRTRPHIQKFDNDADRTESELETNNVTDDPEDLATTTSAAVRATRRKSYGHGLSVATPKRTSRAATTPANISIAPEDSQPIVSARAARHRARASSDARTFSFAVAVPRATPRSSRRLSQSRQLSEEPAEPLVMAMVDTVQEEVEPRSDIQPHHPEESESEQEDQDQDPVAETVTPETKTPTLDPELEGETEPSGTLNRDISAEFDQEESGAEVRISVEHATPISSHDDDDEDSDIELAGGASIDRSLSPDRVSSPVHESPYARDRSPIPSSPSSTSNPLQRPTLLAVNQTLTAHSPAESSSPLNIQSQLQFDVPTEFAEEETRPTISAVPTSEHSTSSPIPPDTQFMTDLSSPMDYSPVNQLMLAQSATDSEPGFDITNHVSEDELMDDRSLVVKQEPQQSDDLYSGTGRGVRSDTPQTDSILTSSPRLISEPASSPPRTVSHSAIDLDDDEDEEFDKSDDSDESSDVEGNEISMTIAVTPPNHRTQPFQEPDSTPVSSSPPSQFDQDMAFHELSPIVEVPEPLEDEVRRKEEHLTPLSSSPPSHATPKQQAKFSLFGTPSISMIFNRGAGAANDSPFASGKKRSLDASHYVDRDYGVDRQDDESSQLMKRRRTQVRNNLENIYKDADVEKSKTTKTTTIPSTSSQPWRLPSLTPHKAPATTIDQNTTPTARSNNIPAMQTPFQTPKQRSVQTPFETPGGHVQVAVTEEQASWYSSFMTPIRNFFQSKPTGKIRGFTLNIIPGRKSNSSTNSTPISATPSGASSFGGITPRTGRPTRSWVPPHLAGETGIAASPIVPSNRNRVSIRDIKRGQTEHLIEQLKKLSPQQEDLELVMEAWKHAKYMAEKSASIDARRQGFSFILRNHPGAAHASETDLRQSEKAYDEHLRQYEPSVIDVIRGRIKAAWHTQQDNFRWSPNTDTVEKVDATDRRRFEVGEKRDERMVEPFEENDDANRSSKRARPTIAERPNNITLDIGSAESNKSAANKAVRFLSPRSQAIRLASDDTVPSNSPLTPTPAVKTMMRTTPHPKSTLSHGSSLSLATQTEKNQLPVSKWSLAQTKQLRRTSNVAGSGTFGVPDISSDEDDDEDDTTLSISDPLSGPAYAEWSQEKKDLLRKTGHIPNSGVFMVPEMSDDEDAPTPRLLSTPSTQPRFSATPRQIPATTANQSSLLRSCLKTPDEGNFNVFAAAAAESKKSDPAPSSTPTTSSSAPTSQIPVPVKTTSTTVAPFTSFSAGSSSSVSRRVEPSNIVATTSSSSPNVVENMDYFTGRQVLGMLASSSPSKTADVARLNQIVWPSARTVQDRELDLQGRKTAREYLGQMWAAQTC